MIRKDMENMDRKQAEQLEECIRHEAPYLVTTLIPVSWVGGQGWAVHIVASSSGKHLGNMENPKEWEHYKQNVLNLPPLDNR